ncbi:hypothetical protein ACOMHN_017315 [Nucella lapillus]
MTMSAFYGSDVKKVIYFPCVVVQSTSLPTDKYFVLGAVDLHSSCMKVTATGPPGLEQLTHCAACSPPCAALVALQQRRKEGLPTASLKPHPPFNTP